MHRSGTSAIARGLQTMGVDLGDNLMPPVSGNNDKGFWEDLDINALNVEMLDLLDKEWHFLAPIQLSDVDTLRKNGYELRALELLRKKTNSTNTFGFKPSRDKIIAFLERSVLQSELEVSYVITLRHPVSVCKSLAKRDGFDIEKGGFLWWSICLTALQKRLEKTVLSLTMIA